MANRFHLIRDHFHDDEEEEEEEEDDEFHRHPQQQQQRSSHSSFEDGDEYEDGYGGHSSDESTSSSSSSLSSLFRKRKEGQSIEPTDFLMSLLNTGSHEDGGNKRKRSNHKKRQRHMFEEDEEDEDEERANINPFHQKTKETIRKRHKSQHHYHQQHHQQHHQPSTRNGMSNALVVVPGTSTTPTPTPGGGSVNPAACGVDWMAYSISEDMLVYKKYGVDPAVVDSQMGPEQCFGCRIQTDSIPVRESNIKLFIEKIAASCTTGGSFLHRAEVLAHAYKELIQNPKKELMRTLERRKRIEKARASGEDYTYNQSDDDDDDDENIEKEEKEDEKGKTNHANTADYLSSVSSCSHQHQHQHQQFQDDSWNVVQIYVHLRHHQKNIIEQIQYRKERLYNMMDVLDNSILRASNLYKDDMKRPLVNSPKDDLKGYLDIHRTWLTLCKSRPDLMRPFIDPDKISGGSGSTISSNGTPQMSDLISFSGNLLFNKKPKLTSAKK